MVMVQSNLIHKFIVSHLLMTAWIAKSNFADVLITL